MTSQWSTDHEKACAQAFSIARCACWIASNINQTIVAQVGIALAIGVRSIRQALALVAMAPIPKARAMAIARQPKINASLMAVYLSQVCRVGGLKIAAVFAM